MPQGFPEVIGATDDATFGATGATDGAPKIEKMFIKFGGDFFKNGGDFLEKVNAL